ncbi:NADH-quinone oxidoreductase subunit NuoE [Pseudaminobacter sp. 19-2017]|uniref:NADH-quinone oxidoreductase subunit NuoE n=1 Tax=Pseudaminobacter soli (ex Zhang et al. 2022) TaxID=2831468 RepID=A0A942DXH2_9HYPH|nr:NADH-quinone oxidoreductase subunit NuoE [Pseudaminobacter soli]MBS3649276.1 NADH-quinone oxidoreductase subunit NuoE [Pseudaminobacter soli]
MSVRRLAEPALQPADFAFTEANAAWAEQTIGKYPPGRQQSAVIPLLMRAQEQEGWVSRAAIEHVADMLDMPYIRVLEVATFYTQYQLNPVGTRAHVQVCGTTPCMLRGAGELMDVCRSRIHPEPFHTNEAGTLSWEEVECQGTCVNAPMVMIFKDTYEDLTPEILETIIDAFEAGKGADVTPGPQNGRFNSAPATGFTTLTNEAVILGPVSERDTRAQAGEPALPPSKAGRPKTDASETSPQLKTPSPVKASPAGETAASVGEPGFNEKAANLAEPSVEAEVKQRRRKSADTGVVEAKSPELLRGEPIGPDSKRLAGEKRAPKGEPSPDARKPTGRKR